MAMTSNDGDGVDDDEHDDDTVWYCMLNRSDDR